MNPSAVLVVTCSLDELRALVRGEVEAALAAVPPPSTERLADKREAARVLNVSMATVTRMTGEGMPHVFVGASPRYALDEVRAWLDARGRRGTRANESNAERETVPGVRLLSRRDRRAAG